MLPGEPTGLLEDAAFDVFSTLLPKPTAADGIAGAKAALNAMNRQGVTSFLDAVAPAEDIAAFAAVRQAGKLTARAHFAPLIRPSEAGDPAGALARVIALAKRYDEGKISRAPGITVRNAKLFLDGVIAAPAFTGAMRAALLRSTRGRQRSRTGCPAPRAGPPCTSPLMRWRRFSWASAAPASTPTCTPTEMALSTPRSTASQLCGRRCLQADIRPAIAHDEIVDPQDFPRFKQLNAIPVLSMQWEKPAGDTLGLKNYFGPARMKILEPAGLLAAAGARIAFGSDWPVDQLDEWFALKVGVTRTNAPDAPPEYRGPAGRGSGPVSRRRVARRDHQRGLRTARGQATGSLEVGKFADLIVLDRNPLKVPAEEIAKTQVLETVVGGQVVYKAPSPLSH